MPSVSWPSIAGMGAFLDLAARDSAMHSDAAAPNMIAFFIGALGFLAGLVGLLVLTFTQQALIGLPIVILGFSTFVTAMMTCAKTTGGPQ